MRGSKRSATSDLNHENWNQEEETEDAGTYEQAPADVIGRRKIRVARRRGVTSQVRRYNCSLTKNERTSQID